MEYDFELVHISGKKNGRADMLSRRPDYDQGENDNKGLVLPPKFFSKMFDKYVDKKEERTPLSNNKKKPQKELTTSARVAGSEEADPNNGPEWRRYLAGIDPVPFDSMQRQVERDQETEESQERLQKWTNTHQLTKEGSFWWKNDQLVVAGDNNLKRGVISLFHDKPSAGHPGITNTYELARKDFWWPNMKQEVEQYVKGCGACQANKINTRPLKPAMIPITPEHSLPFQTVAMDFITKLPKSGKYDTILTITDHDCSKAAIFVPCQETVTAEEVAAIYLRHVYKQYGVPKKIISDRDTRFTSKFAKALCKTLQIHQNISTAYHPRTDGQSERTNQWLEQYLRFFCDERQDNWHHWLPIAEFAHNSWPSATTKKAPFKLIMGYTPRTQWVEKKSPVPTVEERLAKIEEVRKQSHDAIFKAQKVMKMKHKGNKSFKPYKEGDQVWIEGTNLQTLYPSKKLGPKRYGPFKILKHLSDAVYQVEIPRQWKIHNVFHANLITPYKETELHGPNFTRPPSDLIEGEPEYEVEKILEERKRGQGRKTHFLIKWKGYPTSDNSWEKEEDVHAPELIAEFRKWRSKGRKTYIRSARLEEEIPIPLPPTTTFSHLNHSTFTMSAHSAPESVASFALETDDSLSVVSAPENTPTSCSPTPQLAIRSEPIMDHDNDSVVNYNEPSVQEEDDTAPPGYLLNDPHCRHFYPIYLANPQFGTTREEPRMILAKYIKYSTDYRYAYSMLKKGGEVRDLPVKVGRRARHYTRMTENNWRDLMRGNEKEFAVNKALSEMGDLRLTGEINTFRGLAELKKTLDDMLKEARDRVKEVMKELLRVEDELDQSKRRLELANAYHEINDKFHAIFGMRERPRRVVRSPSIIPLPPTIHGPNEMPILMDKEARTQHKCYRCRQPGHVVQECPIPKGSKPRSKRSKRSERGVGHTRVKVTTEEEVQVSPPMGTGEMSLLNRISLLNRSEWTPNVCSLCGKIEPNHSTLDCPLYEQCNRCKGTGAFGYRNSHTCTPPKYDHYPVEDWNDCDYDLYWNGKD